MIDNQKISDYLHELVRKRNAEKFQNQQFNNWSGGEECAWQARTDEIYSAAKDLEKSESQPNDYKSKFLYLAADFDNYKKRVAKSESYAHDKAFQDVMLHFLSIYDDMERLYNEVRERSLYDDDDNVNVDIGPVDSGFEMIFENFEKTLDSLGCEKLNVRYGDKFDVNMMEAISARETKLDEYYKSNEVVDILQSGWKYKDKLIRPTKVVVAK